MRHAPTLPSPRKARSTMTAIPRARFLTSLLLLALAGPAAAGTLFVDASAAPGGNGSSWSSAFRDLQSALALAAPGDQIWVADGRYRPSPSDPLASFVLPDGVAVYGGFAGGESSLAQRDP